MLAPGGLGGLKRRCKSGSASISMAQALDLANCSEFGGMRPLDSTRGGPASRHQPVTSCLPQNARA